MLEELGLVYEPGPVPRFHQKECKDLGYLKTSSNGRLLAINDRHDNDFVAW